MIDLIAPADQLKTFKHDAATLGPALIYAFLVDEIFFEEVFSPALQHDWIDVLGDHRQRGTLKRLAGKHPNLRAATWSYNRTMHDKSVIFPRSDVAWITTANLNRGAWTLSTNGAIRVFDPFLILQLQSNFYSYFNAARRVEPSKIL